MESARKAALSVLDKIEKDGAYTNIALDNLFYNCDYSAADRRFISALVYGVVRRIITLDYIVSKYVKKGAGKLPATVKNVLRMAVFQLLFMDKVPDFAAVDQSVRLVKASKHSYLSGLVNAVLRNVIKGDNSLPADDSTASLSVRYSCGKDAVAALVEDLGVQTAKHVLEDALLPPPVYIRVNTLKTNADDLMATLKAQGINCEKTALENALSVSGDVTHTAAYKTGLFHTEDIACQTAISLLSPKPGERLLDTCSAPGGKAFTAAQMMNGTGGIVALDLYPARVSLIEEGAARLGINNIQAAAADASVYRKNMGVFDAVLCDVPCSGTGVIRRKPEIKYKPLGDLASLYETQKKILSSAAKYVRPGGRLMYSTCTLSKRENGGRVSAFLVDNKDFSLVSERTFLPHTDLSDGFYCALLRKNG